MKNIKEANLQELFSANNGIVTTQILVNGGLSSRNIKRLVDDGFIEKIKLGYYMEKQHFVSDAVLASRLIPAGVLCLFTAVGYYDLATVNPSVVSIAVPRDFTLPKLPPSLFIKAHHMTSSHFEAGITEVDIDGAIVRMYDMEKTVCDCFKYENEVERNIALEVLKNYMARRGRNIQKLSEYARLLNKQKLIYPYVEALV